MAWIQLGLMLTDDPWRVVGRRACGGKTTYIEVQDHQGNSVRLIADMGQLVELGERISGAVAEMAGATRDMEIRLPT